MALPVFGVEIERDVFAFLIEQRGGCGCRGVAAGKARR